MLKNTTQFDIRIKDNFFPEEDFNYIKNVAKNIKFAADNVHLGSSTRHVWFTVDAPKEICNILSKRVSDFFKVNILKMTLCTYSLVAKSDKVQVHKDISENTNFQTILYIEGDENIHSGTGFYIYGKKNNNYVLNTHVGFRPNRIVSWDADIYHAPLSFTDSYKKRISLITQYKIEEK